jgi:hypothetical protein
MTNLDETQGVRITTSMIYKKQLEMNELQIRGLEKLEQLEDIPDRIREVELTLARLAWIEKIAYTGLTGSIIAVIGLIVTTIGK